MSSSGFMGYHLRRLLPGSAAILRMSHLDNNVVYRQLPPIACVMPAATLSVIQAVANIQVPMMAQETKLLGISKRYLCDSQKSDPE